MPGVVVLISADAEWRAAEARLSSIMLSGETPYGEWVTARVGTEEIVFVHGGWGKISAAGSTQYAINHWKPAILVNLGTCGGFAGLIEAGEMLLVERTLVYDIVEKMGDSEEAIAHYTTRLPWPGVELPPGVHRSLLVSADRDLIPEEVQRLKERYDAVAGDWESGAIAWVAARNQVPCVILRGVTDLVGADGGEAYGDYALFARRTEEIMGRLFDSLPTWLNLLSRKPV